MKVTKSLPFFLLADPPDLNPDEVSHQKPYQHKSRRGRPRHNNDRNLSSNSYDPSQQYGHFQQGFNPSFSHDNSKYALHQHLPYQGEDGARRRGRGRREGNRSVNGNFGGSGPWWQRAGGDCGSYSGNNRGVGVGYSGAHSMDGPDGPNWRREDMSRNLEQTNEEQDARAKKPRKFSQEQRRGQQNEKGAQLKEDNTPAGGQRSKGENPHFDNRERTQRSRTGPDFQHDDHQRKHSEAKRRQGPIKPPKPPPQEELGSERAGSVQDDSGHGRSSQDPPFKAGRGSGRHVPLQARGGRRTQNHRPGQKGWDKMPESKETQTG